MSKTTHRCTWPDHWTNGGTGITKLGNHPVADDVRESVGLFNDPDIFLNKTGDEMHSTRKIKNGDLSDFWQFHRNRLNQNQ
jgi:hypothetical protein